MWILLLAISILVSLLNYSPGTYLSGWDTLHPEFNFPEYFKRVIFGVWQAHQGLGAVASQAHASELPRLLILYPLSFIFPDSWLRYFYIFATLAIGPLGVYFFIRRVINLKEVFAFTGGLFYLLNLVTVQQFIVPFEMFATQFAALSWLFLLAFKALEEPSRKWLFLFALASFFSASMAHTPTLWYAYFLSLAVFLAVYSYKRKLLRAYFKILLLALLINSFWILPNIYFSLNHAGGVVNSKIHTLFTEEAFAQNASFGNPKDLILFKNFLFNWSVYTGDNRFEPLLSVWINHLKNPFVNILGYIFFAVAALGIIYSIKARFKAFLPLVSVFFLTAFFLLNANPPFGFIFSFLQDNIPYFREAIRFPFTKFSIIFIFLVSIYFAIGVKFLSQKISGLRYSNVLIGLIVLVSLVFYTLPAFRGNLISPHMRVNIPNEYFALFEYFKDKPMGRIANFPIHSFWGWTHYEWPGQSGKKQVYQGAGFLWFGLKQPLLDREFDRWQPLNEQYYREMSHALYTKNSQAFKSTLLKYDISYILLDKSVVAPSQNPKILFTDELQNILEELGARKEKEFGGNLIVYNLGSKRLDYTLKSIQSTSPKLTGYEDFVFQKSGNYFLNETGSSYPFTNTIDNQSRIYKNLDLSQEGAFVDLPEGALEIPPFIELEKLFAVDLAVEKRGSVLRSTFIPKFPKSETPMTLDLNLPANERNFLLSINQEDNFTLNNIADNTPLTLGTVFLKTKENNTVSLYRDKDDNLVTPNFQNLSLDLKPCNEEQKGGTFGLTPRDNAFTLYADRSYACLTIPLSNFRGQFAGSHVLLGVHLNSQNPAFCIANLQSGNCRDYYLKNIILNPVTVSKSNSFFEVETTQVDNLGLKFFLNALDEQKNVSYDNVSFSFRRPIANTSFLKEIGESLKTFKFEDGLSIPFSGNEELSLDITKLPKTQGDCPINNPGLSAQPRKTVIQKEFENYIRYEAEEGSYCDHFSYQNLPLDQAYLIAVKSRNIKGLPIRFCVTNLNSGRCDIYAHLSSSKEFKTDIFLLPPMQKSQDGRGFDININNFAVKNIGAINDVSSIQIIPFPYYWLSNIKVVGNESKSDVLVLSQAFEPGWKAYEGRPFIGRELKNHVLVNGWANGWVLNKEAEKYSFVFLPQYLEYVGFILSLGAFAYILRRKYES